MLLCVGSFLEYTFISFHRRQLLDLMLRVAVDLNVPDPLFQILLNLVNALFLSAHLIILRLSDFIFILNLLSHFELLFHFHPLMLFTFNLHFQFINLFFSFLLLLSRFLTLLCQSLGPFWSFLVLFLHFLFLLFLQINFISKQIGFASEPVRINVQWLSRIVLLKLFKKNWL